MTVRSVSIAFFAAAVLGFFPKAAAADGSKQERSVVFGEQEPDTARTDLAFFDGGGRSESAKNIKKFTAVDVSRIPDPVKMKVSSLYPDYTWVNSGKNRQEEYALIILTKDSVRKTLVIKENGEILSDK